MKNEIKEQNLDFNVLKKEFLEYVDIAETSITTYNAGIRQFIYYLQDNNIDQPTRNDVLAFKNYLLETNHSISTVNGYLIALRNFFKFLAYNGIYKNITENVKGLKDVETHKREALTQEQCAKLLEIANDDRERMVLLMLATCGLRANEIVNIRLNDIKYESGNYVVYVLGKGHVARDEHVIIPDELFEMIQKYVKKYNIQDYLFVSTSNHNKGGKLSTRTIERIINGLYERLGIKTDKIVVHSLRHTFATLSIENGMDIREVSKALRHKNTATTETYLHDLEMKNNKCTNTVASILIPKEEN